MSMPALSGIYRGRALEAALLPSGLARISIRAANPRRLLDEIRADDASAIVGAAWLNAPLRQDVSALRDRWRRIGNISIRGNFVTVNAPCASTDPAHLRALLELAHRLAENVDSATGGFQVLALG